MGYYKKTILHYNLCRSLLAYQFLSDPCFIHIIPSSILRYMWDVFHCANNVCVRVPLDCLWSMDKDSAHAMRNRWGGFHAGGKNICAVCAENYSGEWFTALSRGPIPGTSLVPSTTGDWRDELRGSCISTTSWPRLRSGCWPSHVQWGNGLLEGIRSDLRYSAVGRANIYFIG